jgi:hypothetical protein
MLHVHPGARALEEDLALHAFLHAPGCASAKFRIPT